MESLYNQVSAYKKKYPLTIAHRLSKHCDIIEKHLNPGEVVTYAFAGQRNAGRFDIFETCVVAITNERILIGQKRVLWGYFLSSITPDLYNDMQIFSGIIWGNIEIDTVKEVTTLSNISKKALPEIETAITSFMMEAKKKYAKKENSSK